MDLPGLHILPAPVDTVQILLTLLRRNPVVGGSVFDLQIAATMLANGVHRIYTFNTGDFRIFPELDVMAP
jgi:predicted nucleic acid-binding protein